GFLEGGPRAFLLAAPHPFRVDHIATFGAYGKARKSSEYPDLVATETRRKSLLKWLEDWGRGEDIGGTGVHIAARIESLAQANEVLVSRTVTDFMTGNRTFKFVNNGLHSLRDVLEKWKIISVER
ncbi:MAG: hypothetical protein V7701_07125, partial [Sneathiella sp.]